MSDEDKSEQVNAFAAYMVVAAAGAFASAVIALIAMVNFHYISDSGLWAVAVMVLAPALMAVGVSFFISKSSPSRSSEGKG